MSRIPQGFIDELVGRIDIVEVIDARVPLKRRGREYIACCPFHGEKTPSFTVSPDKQFYHCFGCGAHGTAIGFLMEFERMEFVEAVETLAQSQGLEVPREGGVEAPRERHDSLLDLMAKAERFFREQLKATPAAIEYLKERGLSGETAAAFALGYAPDRWDALLSRFAPNAAEDLERAGLVIRREQGGHYDRFRGRVMFPIRDRRGRTIGFGGRVLGQGEPKYLNSPETPLFHKGRELYGLYEARRGEARLDRVLVVEGYMDVIALAQAGISNVVATLGTATTAEHLERLFRMTAQVVFCFDGDRAGRQAAWRALETALPVLNDARAAYFLFLPEGEDPDSLVRAEGAEGLNARLASATGVAEFLLQGLRERHETGTAAGRARLTEAARGLLAPLTEGVLKDQIVEALARLVGLDGARLARHLSGEVPQAPAREPGLRRTPMRRTLALLLAEPTLAQALEPPPWLAASTLPGAALLRELLETLRREPQLSSAALIERWRGREEADHLARLLAEPEPPAEAEVRARELQDALERLRLKDRALRAENLLEQSRIRPLEAGEKEELRRLLPDLQGPNHA
jgi:DNA primase